MQIYTLPVHTHPGVCDLELTQDILRHVVLSHWVNNKVLVASRALRWPVLVALLLWTKGPVPMIRWGGIGEGRSRFQKILGKDPLSWW